VTGELVYQGVVRTPLCGVAHRIAFRGETTGVMNEWFATSADVYRVTGELWAPHDQHPSADNGPKTVDASCVRLARMIGRDAADAAADDWRALAHSWRREQLRAIGAGVAQVCDAHPALADAPLVGAGCGRFLAAALAREMSREYVDFSVLAGACVKSADAPQTDDTHARRKRDERDERDDRNERDEWIATCAPGVAVALLMAADATQQGADSEPRAAQGGRPARAA
jgi:(4-(4-[2-(gamma-L-glutamylamino)ethyl]phenoxymethyl)furan-2-yl)methanamine synthase